MAAENIIPIDFKEHHLGGNEMGVVFISTNRKFDILRLVSLVERKLYQKLGGRLEDIIITLQDVNIAVSSHNPPVSSQEPSVDKELVMSCLRKFYLFNCDSIHELTMTMIFLKSFLLNAPHIRLILIDQVLTCDTVQERVDTKWMELLREYSNHIVVVMVTEPHIRLGEEWQRSITQSYYTTKKYHTMGYDKDPVQFCVSSIITGHSWYFTINNNGVCF